MTVDPTKIHVESSNYVPIWEQEQSFQEIMADQLRHAPWLLLSIVVHGIAFLILMALPAPEKLPPSKVVEMKLQDEPEPEEEIEEPEEEPVEEEEVVEDVVIQDQEITENEVVSENFEEMSDVKESAFDSDQWNSAVGLGGGAGGKYGGRGGGRGGKAPGGKATAVAIELGLQWLKDHQDEDGKWDSDDFMKHDTEGDVCDGPGNAVHDVGNSGLALLAFLGDGSTLRAGAYRDQIKSGINWLRKEQNPDTGLFGTNSSHDYIYSHAIASYAMIEAYGLSDYKSLKRYAQKALGYLEYHRNPYNVWRYDPKGGDNDTSVTGWCIMAYESGKYFDLEVNDAALELCKTWLDSVTDPATGRAGYMELGQPSSRRPGDHGIKFPPEKGEAMTAVSVFCRYFMKQDPDETPVIGAGVKTIMARPPVWDVNDGSIDHYYWYYATYAIFQWGKSEWKNWSKKIVEAVVKTQRSDGNFKGSWDPIGAWGDDGGRVYSTATLVLTLEAYYRYSTLVR